MSFAIDVDERCWSKAVMAELLRDRTTKKNIVWATEDYLSLGREYAPDCQLEYHRLVADLGIIQPRVLKSLQDNNARTKNNGEVFTPCWMCNRQNNAVDAIWFGREHVFNQPVHEGWIVQYEPIEFPESKTWQEYVAEPRLEVTCGEAPYLVSRYDPVSGNPIPLHERIGLLDRKLRIVNENTHTYDQWWHWTQVAYQSVYGFELQGDSLLIARENLLATFVDNMEVKWQRVPYEHELLTIAEIIAWNLWQMDGMSGRVPYEVREQEGLMLLFDVAEDDAEQNNSSAELLHLNKRKASQDVNQDQRPYCLIKDWSKKRIIPFKDLQKS